MKQIAIIGPTASGKSDLAIKIAHKFNAYILSIDSLSIYKEIDIVSAKPNKDELREIKHFGIDELFPDEQFNVNIFMDLYKKVKCTCEEDGKNLIIIGGTSFYLKSLLQGLSLIPKITKDIEAKVDEILKDVNYAHSYLAKIDPTFANSLLKNDKYRIQKALLIYEASKITPTEWFKNNPPKPIIENLDIFNIEVSRDILRKRIEKRTQKMLDLGLIDEICYLEQKYTRKPNSMGAIGIVEVLEYLDSKVTKKQMLENISIHTAQLAKRQQTYNKTQFKNSVNAPLDELTTILLDLIKS